ncbi:MAG: AarF/ABC1/UbiB kinase family protein [Chromatiaceae bacterium]|jgi:predicted unusual protein kinase regulating ubiquinone biosynthesis (AarF/ABC1/UbiB family)|nr:AarF/ABC1/UbiB kinase family protein [Chromatiaceae bacterium]
MNRSSTEKSAPVPSGRAARLWHLGRAAGGLATAAALQAGLAALRGRPAGDLRLSVSPAQGQRLAEHLSRLRGAAMKLGQLLSLDGRGVLPPELVEVLAPLRDGAHLMPFSQVVAVLESEYGNGWQRQFRRFAFTPVAAASIGQVHRAETRDGRVLAIKVQYPGVRESIDSDLDNLRLLGRLAGLIPAGVDIDPLLAEARAQLHREADYGAEAEALTRYGRLLGADPMLAVPEVVPELSTSRVLAMSFAEGVAVDRLAANGAPQAVRDRVAEALSRLALRELFELGLVQSDPNFANYLYDEASGRLVLLDFGAVQRIPAGLAEGYRRLARAAAANDPAGVRASAEEIGYLGDGVDAGQANALTALIVAAAEPLRHRGYYDFGASDLFARVYAQGKDLVFGQGFRRSPPPATLFLHRKFVGTFLLCARLRARVDVASLVEPWLRVDTVAAKEAGQPGTYCRDPDSRDGRH